MRIYRKGDMYTNGKFKFIIDGIWWRGTNPKRVELKNMDTGKIFEYEADAFELAVEEQKLKLIFK
jgi:hypothetical protein